MFAGFLNRNPVSSPAFVNAAATVPTRSLEADEAVRCSARSSIHLTGTPVLRLTAAGRAMYEKTACLIPDRKSTGLNSRPSQISYAVFVMYETMHADVHQ